MYNRKILEKLKGEWIYILSRKAKYYTKEVLKLTNIIAIGILIILSIIFTKFKPVYAVYIEEEKIGCIQDKKEFEKIIEENLYNNNKEKNIAFVDMNNKLKYNLNLINKNTKTDEDQVLLAVEEDADKTYFQYAINVDGENKAYLKTEQEANEVLNNLRENLQDNNVGIETIYTKTLEVEEKEALEIANNIIEEVRKQEKIEASTINGVYISCIPVKGNITSRYGVNESIRDHTHQGLDIAAPTGTEILAASNGKVTYSGVKGGYGNMIIVDHGNGIETYYGHCSKLYVKEGQIVEAGDKIAAVGSTGNSTGPHLHFEIRSNGKYVNPQKYLYNE